MKGDDYMAREITGAHLDCTKAELRTAFYLFLDDALPTFTCKLIEKRGNYLCDRCDKCMMEQYIERARSGCTPKHEQDRARPATVGEATKLLSKPCYENMNT